MRIKGLVTEELFDGYKITCDIIRMGHKDDMVAKWFAEEIARKENCTVVCSCGIHVDNITAEQIKIVTEKSSILLRKIEEEIENI